ncbi:hypothetical protein [Enhygromyxa salina]|uniref:hypothetical protein n=1 Tax=Enhygromyxa salina TaxID=215803 RepID=UPI000698E309|nr:hypothetical protein [Enhygromyxa salina]
MTLLETDVVRPAQRQHLAYPQARADRDDQIWVPAWLVLPHRGEELLGLLEGEEVEGLLGYPELFDLGGVVDQLPLVGDPPRAAEDRQVVVDRLGLEACLGSAPGRLDRCVPCGVRQLGDLVTVDCPCFDLIEAQVAEGRDEMVLEESSAWTRAPLVC